MRKNPAPAVDIIIERNSAIALVKRRFPPFKGFWELPGGFVEYGETVEHAAKREAREETGLQVELLEILGVYSSPKRDPRRHTLSIPFIARIKRGELKAGSDAAQAKWFSLKALPRKLAFDHSKILKDYLKWRRRGGGRGGTFWSTK